MSDELEFRNSGISLGDVIKVGGIVVASYAAVAFGGVAAAVGIACLVVGFLAGWVMKH